VLVVRSIKYILPQKAFLWKHVEKCSPVFTGGETKAVIGQVEKFLKRKAKISEKKKK
jgi:hypothetical protein